VYVIHLINSIDGLFYCLIAGAIANLNRPGPMNPIRVSWACVIHGRNRSRLSVFYRTCVMIYKKARVACSPAISNATMQSIALTEDKFHGNLCTVRMQLYL
jgi:hypothetical protein